jgi:hypothetical protein
MLNGGAIRETHQLCDLRWLEIQKLDAVFSAFSSVRAGCDFPPDPADGLDHPIPGAQTNDESIIALECK